MKKKKESSISQNLSDLTLVLDDMWKEKKTFRRAAEQLVLFLIDHPKPTDMISEATLTQIKGFIQSYQLTYENMELLEGVLKIRLKDLQEKKKK